MDGESRCTSRFDANRFTYVKLGSDFLRLSVKEIIFNCIVLLTVSQCRNLIALRDVCKFTSRCALQVHFDTLMQLVHACTEMMSTRFVSIPSTASLFKCPDT